MSAPTPADAADPEIGPTVSPHAPDPKLRRKTLQTYLVTAALLAVTIVTTLVVLVRSAASAGLYLLFAGGVATATTVLFYIAHGPITCPPLVWRTPPTVDQRAVLAQLLLLLRIFVQTVADGTVAGLSIPVMVMQAFAAALAAATDFLAAGTGTDTQAAASDAAAATEPATPPPPPPAGRNRGSQRGLASALEAAVTPSGITIGSPLELDV